MHTTHSNARHHQQGFTLVEVLVAVAISLFGMLAIFTAVATWNSHTRATVSGGDAQSSGALALFNLERDIRQAGMGFSMRPAVGAPTIVGCNVQGQQAAVPFNFPLVPVQIVNNANPQLPDSLVVLHGDSSFYTALNTFTASNGAATTMQRPVGFNAGDVVVIADGAVVPPVCQLAEVTGTAAAPPNTVNHGVGNYTSFYTGAQVPVRYNPPPAVPFTTGNIFNLGPNPQLNQWQVNPANAAVSPSALMRTNLMAAAPVAVEIAEQVIDLRAIYVVDNSIGAVVPVPPNPQPLLPAGAVPANWAQVVAIDVAILVRSRQFEKSLDPNSAVPVPVTPNNPVWVGGQFPMAGPQDLSPNDWRFYRYRVYQKRIPLRNMIWG